MNETQSADKAPVVVAMPSTPNPPPVAEVPAVATEKSKVVSEKPVLLLDRYTVVAGDTLSKIAEKREVYGDARLWPLLQRTNSHQVGPQGQLLIGQVLSINQNFSTEEKTNLTGKSRVTKSDGAKDKPQTPPITTIVSPVANTPEVVPAATPAPATPVTTPVTPPASIPVVATTAQAPAATPNAMPEVSKQTTAKADEYLNAARRAFSAGDLPWAIYYYNAHLNTQSRDANAWGELGNVFYATGKIADSAQAYFKAANILIDQGQTAHAIQLIPAIEAGNPSLSEAIHSRLTAARR